MEIGSVITIIIVALVLLGLFLVPIIRGVPAEPEKKTGRAAEREKAYRRGLLIGGLMSQAGKTTDGDPQRAVEQVFIEQQIIERMQQQREHEGEQS